MDNKKYIITEILDFWLVPKWDRVPYGTRILVRNEDDELWTQAYFAQYKDEKVYAFLTMPCCNERHSNCQTPWDHGKLASSADPKNPCKRYGCKVGK